MTRMEKFGGTPPLHLSRYPRSLKDLLRSRLGKNRRDASLRPINDSSLPHAERRNGFLRSRMRA
jgi:hypothetical protein